MASTLRELIVERRNMRRSGLGSPVTSALTHSAQTLADQLVLSASFNSQLTPPVKVDRPLSPRAAQREGRSGFFTNAIMSVVKPEVVIETPAGVKRMAPWGEPTTNLYPVVVAGMIAGSVLAAGVVWRAFTR